MFNVVFYVVVILLINSCGTAVPTESSLKVNNDNEISHRVALENSTVFVGVNAAESCTGSIIQLIQLAPTETGDKVYEAKILTAAHCFDQAITTGQREAPFIRLGSNIFNVRRIDFHPNYAIGQKGRNNDLAILTLNIVDDGSFGRLSALPISSKPAKVGDTIFFIGYGFIYDEEIKDMITTDYIRKNRTITARHGRSFVVSVPEDYEVFISFAPLFHKDNYKMLKSKELQEAAKKIERLPSSTLFEGDSGASATALYMKDGGVVQRRIVGVTSAVNVFTPTKLSLKDNEPKKDIAVSIWQENILKLGVSTNIFINIATKENLDFIRKYAPNAVIL